MPSRATSPVGTLSRAAIVYLGAVLASGCGPGSANDDPGGEETVLQPYGAPPDPEPLPDPEPEPPPEVEVESPPDTTGEAAEPTEAVEE